MSAVEALRRLEDARGWDEADLNDFAIIEARLAAFERLLAAAEEVIEDWSFSEDDLNRSASALARAVRECSSANPAEPFSEGGTE